jgi:anti-sigma B factor antagonist
MGQIGSAAATIVVVEHGGGIRGLRVGGEIDSTEADLLERAGIDLLGAAPAMVVVDLGDVRYFGSRGMTALLRIQWAAAEAGVRLRIVTGEANRPVLRPLTITGLDRELDLFPDLAAALSG